MTNIIENERSWWIKLISKIDSYVKEKSYIIKKSGWESWLKCWWKTLFPDVYLFWWIETNNILQWWELKLPDTKITDNELIENAIIKADSLWLNSFLIWNFSIAVLYIKQWSKFLVSKTWNDLEEIKTRKEAIDIIQNSPKLWEDMLMKIIDDLNIFLKDWTLIWKSLVDAIDLNVIVDSISNFSLTFQDYLKNKSISNIVLESEIDLWWYENKLSYQEKKDDKKWEILTKIIINNWINKIIYAHILKKHYNEVLIIENLSDVKNVSQAIEIFDEISLKCDFWNIFRNYSIKTENINVDEYIPIEILNAFKEFNSFLNDFNIEKLSSELTEKFLINTIFQNKRKLAWQFSTPDKLARLLVRSLIDDKTKDVYDWCCWTWTIIKEVYNYKIEWLSDSQAINSLYASDKFSFPIQISNINLSNPKNRWRLLQLFKKDIFDVNVWTSFKVYDPDNWEEIIKLVPEMDFIVSNLPFIQQEDFQKFNPEIKNILNNKIKEELDGKYEINGRSDIYAYILIHLYSLIRNDWKIWIIVSNSWLSSDWWEDFKKVLLSYFKIEKIITSWKWKWFNNADVVTNIIILKKRNNIWEVDFNEEIRFITINENINILDKESINNISKQILVNRSINDDILINKYSYSNIISFENLNIWWNALFSNVYFLENIKSKISNLSDYFEVQRGEKTWCDPLFYPSENNWIENEFIKKTLKTTKWNKFYDIIPDDNTFICNLSMNDLISNNKQWTIHWINKFENNKKSITTKKWKEWYDLPCNIKVDFVINVNPDKSIVFYWLNESSYIWQRGIWLKINQWHNKELLHALLNSILSIFFVEAVWFWRWLWALDLNSTKIHKMKILDPNLLNEEQINNIIEKFNIIKWREIKSIDKEFNLTDRKDFDMYVLKCYWIDNIYEDLKEALLNLFKIRSSVKE